jgi:hypothetical protein
MGKNGKSAREVADDNFRSVVGSDETAALPTRECFGLTVTEAMWKGAAVMRRRQEWSS